jgi:flagellar biosynthesis protein FlhB
MSDESFQERTEKATPKRREKAREEGKVAKSSELNAAAIICLGFTALFLMGPQIAERMQGSMRYLLSNAPSIALELPSFYRIFSDNVMSFMILVAPVFIAMTVIGAGINIAQVGFKITPKAIEPKLDKLNLASGLKKLFSMRSVVQGLRDSLKLAVVGFIAYKAISHEFYSFFTLPDQNVVQMATTLAQLTLKIALEIGAAILVIAVLDYLYQKYEFEKSIKMSKQDLRDESKNSEGNPQTKARVRQIQREMSRRRMMSEVATADVVVTNPTHLAVALKYQPDSMDAPMMVAKGERLIAQKIKEIARQHGIPVIEDKPLARALFKMCDIGQMIPAKLFKAVAEVLAHIYKLKNKAVR